MRSDRLITLIGTAQGVRDTFADLLYGMIDFAVSWLAKSARNAGKARGQMQHRVTALPAAELTVTGTLDTEICQFSYSATQAVDAHTRGPPKGDSAQLGLTQMLRDVLRVKRSRCQAKERRPADFCQRRQPGQCRPAAPSLDASGYDVITAADGPEVRAVTRESVPDLLTRAQTTCATIWRKSALALGIVP